MLSDLRVAASELDRASWAVTGYLIGYTAAMPLMGRISDRFGFRNTYLAAMAVFALGLYWCRYQRRPSALAFRP